MARVIFLLTVQARVIFLLTVQARVIFLFTVQARVIFLLTDQEKIFQKSTNQKQELPVVAMFVNRSGQNEHSLQMAFHRCFLPSFSSFGSALSEEKIFQNRPIRNKNCLWWPCLLMNRDEMSNLYRGPSKDAPYQVSIHLAKQFQRRRFFQKSTNQKQEWPVVAMFVNGSERNEQSLQRTCHRCFLPRFGSLGQVKRFQRRRFLKIGQSETRIAYGGHVC